MLGDLVVEQLEPEIVEGEELEIDEDGEMEIRPRFPYVAMHPEVESGKETLPHTLRALFFFFHLEWPVGK